MEEWVIRLAFIFLSYFFSSFGIGQLENVRIFCWPDIFPAASSVKEVSVSGTKELNQFASEQPSEITQLFKKSLEGRLL